jgi:hypothetical protein
VDAYTRYFRQTVANFEAQYQTREFRIGRPWNPAAGETDSGPDARVEAIIEMLTSLGKALGNNMADIPSLLQSLGLSKKTAADAIDVDEEGFRHFEGRAAEGPRREGFTLAGVFKNAGTEAGTFFTDVADALRKDIGMTAEPGEAEAPKIA